MKNDRILKLTIKKQWFDMILSGEKKEEYREIKPFYQNRLMLHANCVNRSCFDCLSRFLCSEVSYDFIEFSNGYRQNAPKILMEYKGVEIGIGDLRYGAPVYPVFKLKLGNIVELRNVK